MPSTIANGSTPFFSAAPDTAAAQGASAVQFDRASDAQAATAPFFSAAQAAATVPFACVATAPFTSTTPDASNATFKFPLVSALALTLTLTLTGCSLLPDFLTFKKDYQSLTDADLKELCSQKKDAVSCQVLGERSYKLWENFRDRQARNSAEKYYSEACNLLDAQGCAGVAHCYITKVPYSKEDLVTYNRYTFKACTYGLGSSCVDMGLNYLNGQYFEGELITARNPIHAQDFFASACMQGTDERSGEGCAYCAQTYLEGIYIPVDYEKAHDYYEQGCALNSEVCVTLGTLFEEGGLGERDPKKALDYYERGCRLDTHKGQERGSISCEAALRLKGSAGR